MGDTQDTLGKIGESIMGLPSTNTDVNQVATQSQSLTFLPSITVSSPGAVNEPRATTALSPSSNLGSVPFTPQNPALDETAQGKQGMVSSIFLVAGLIIGLGAWLIWGK